MSKFFNQLKHRSKFSSQKIYPRLNSSPSTFRLWTFKLFLTFHLLLLTFHSCGLDIEDPTPPSAPRWVQKSPIEDWPERGIDAHESGGIYLEWESLLEEDLIAYSIFRATWFAEDDSLGEYGLLKRLEIDSTPETEYIDSDAHIRTEYFYKIVAEDASGGISESSDSVGYSLLQPIRSEWMRPNGLNDRLEEDRTLHWVYFYVVAMENYYFTILNHHDELVIRGALLPGDYISGYEYLHIPDSIILMPGNYYKWRIDTGANHNNGREATGSESAWATFLYSDP